MTGFAATDRVGLDLLWAKARAFVRKDFRTSLSYRFAFVISTLFDLLWVAAFYFFGRMVGEVAAIPSLVPYGGAYFPFVLVGVAFSSYLSFALTSFSDTIRTAQVMGTLEALLCTPTPTLQILLFSSTYSFLATSLRMVLTLVIGWLFFGVSFAGANWGGAILVLLLTIVSFSFLGIFSAAVVMVFKRGDPSAYLVQGLSYLLGGVFYPLSVLPEWAQWLANLLPITHALEAMRKLLLMGAPLAEVTTPLLLLAGFCVLAGPLSIGAFFWALKRVEREGSLSQF